MPRTIRRLVATNKADDLEACVAFVGVVTGDVRRHAVDGLAQALKSRQVDAPPSWKRVFAELLKDSDGKTRELARRLAVNFQQQSKYTVCGRVLGAHIQDHRAILTGFQDGGGREMSPG